MGRILMSINPIHVEKILSGVKRFEYRKVKCAKKIDTILVYATAPIMKVVGEVEVLDILSNTPTDIWECTKKASGISRAFFDQYFEGYKTAVAYALGKVTLYQIPLDLSELGVKSPPQSFVYLENTNSEK